MLMVMDKENFFNAPPTHFASTDSLNRHEIAALTRRFSRSASIQQPLYILKEKRGFSGSPESGFGWPVSSEPPSPPPPFVKTDEDAWNLIYAAAEQVARMKMRMNMAAANKNNTGLIGASRAFAHPHSSPWGTSDGNEFFRQPHFCQNRACNENSANNGGGGGGGGGGVRSQSFPHSAWPPLSPQLQPKPCNLSAMKPAVAGGSGGGGGSSTAAKKECAGTGVFLPRRYCNNPPESRKGQACSPDTLPARMIQSSSITPPINGGFIPHYGGQQRRSSTVHGGVKESVVNNPEMLLPQEWTY